jgi:hypothetical protein
MFLELNQPYTHKIEALNIKPSSRRLLVSIEYQSMNLIESDALVREFEVSTSLNPPSNVEDSGGTPRGLHRIAQKIGEGALHGEVFKGRVSIGKRYQELGEDERKPNLITTRILWLEGLEPGINQGDGCDSFKRYIYIHGTNHEDRVGQPASGGCIQLMNNEMIALFDAVDEGDHVFIE